MFDVYDKGIYSITGLILAIAIAGWLIVSLGFGVGIIIGIVVGLLIMKFWPTVIELFI